MSPAEVGFESHPPHHHVENGGGVVWVMLRVFGLPEDLAAVVVFTRDVLEARVDEGTDLFRVLGDLGDVLLLVFEELLSEGDVDQRVLDVLMT